MTPPAASPTRSVRDRIIALLCLALLAAAFAWQPAPSQRLQAAWFDALQRVAPRPVETLPVTIVAIDEKSLGTLGQWPWPRTVTADLIRAIARHGPAVIGVDVLMPEPDRLSPDRVLAATLPGDPVLAGRVAALPSNDAVLAAAVASAPVVLAAAATRESSASTLRAAPVVVSGPAGAHAPGGIGGLTRYGGVISSIDMIDRAAAGHGVITAESADGVFRRFPLVVDVNGTLAPALAVELLRVALKEPALRLRRDGAAVRGVSVGDVDLPTDADGAVTLHYSHGDPRRFVSAVDVLEGRVGADLLARKIVLIGATGVGLRDDYRATPLGEAMPGSEIHAQLVENLFDQSYLRRPGASRAVELALFVLLGVVLVHVTPRWKPHRAALLALASVAAAAAASFAAFRVQRLLVDATPAVGLLLLFGLLLVLTLAEAARRRRALERTLQAEREQAAFVQGELDAARRIQAGMLPGVELLRADARIDLAAAMTPAREVGGDLYDFFFVDRNRLFFLIGDVAGKGLSASLFMAVSKALCKSVALRARDVPIGELMTQANAEVSRDNATMLFVSAFIAVLDLDSGLLTYCNAGHDNPYALHADRALPLRLVGGDGPPLCVVDEFAYRGAQYPMVRGETLCLVTDGVVEARNPAGALYGTERLGEVLERLHDGRITAQGLVAGLQADVATFVDGAEAADDLTLLVLRWNGPAAAD